MEASILRFTLVALIGARQSNARVRWSLFGLLVPLGVAATVLADSTTLRVGLPVVMSLGTAMLVVAGPHGYRRNRQGSAAA